MVDSAISAIAIDSAFSAAVSKGGCGSFIVNAPSESLAFATAMKMAQTLFCEYGNACGKCMPCIRFSEGGEPDFSLIQSDGAILKPQVEAIPGKIAIKPKKHRAILIASAANLNANAANLLLKSIEEPPPGTFFLLATSNISALLPTIVSRCVVVNIAKMGYAEMIGHLGEEKKQVLAARLSGGDIAKAEQILIDEKVFSKYDMVNACLDNGQPLSAADRTEAAELLEILGIELCSRTCGAINSGGAPGRYPAALKTTQKHEERIARSSGLNIKLAMTALNFELSNALRLER